MSCLILYKNDALGKITLALARHLMYRVIEDVNSRYEGTLKRYEFDYAPLQSNAPWMDASEHLDMTQYKAPSMSLPEGIEYGQYAAFVVLAANLEAKCVEQLSAAAKRDHDVSIIGVERALADGAFSNVLYVTPEALVGHDHHTPALYHTTFDLLAGLYNTFVKEHSPGPLLSVSVARILADERLMEELKDITPESVFKAGQYIIDQYSVAEKLETI